MDPEDFRGSLLPLLRLVTAPKAVSTGHISTFSIFDYQLFSLLGSAPGQADPQWQHRAQHQENLPMLMTSVQPHPYIDIKDPTSMLAVASKAMAGTPAHFGADAVQ